MSRVVSVSLPDELFDFALSEKARTGRSIPALLRLSLIQRRAALGRYLPSEVAFHEELT